METIDKMSLKWVLELCSQQGYKKPYDVISAYYKHVLGV